MPENKSCSNCGALITCPFDYKNTEPIECFAWCAADKPAPVEKRVFEGMLDKDAIPHKCWPGLLDYLATTEGKKTRITVEVLK